MKINKIRIKFESKEVLIPTKGTFDDGLNIIYSDSNNMGKTTILRSIFKAFFSDAIVMPNPKPEIGSVIKVEVLLLSDGKTFLFTNNFETETISVENNGEKRIFLTKSDLLQFFFPKFPNEKQIRPSIVGSSLLMDQDYWTTDSSLWPSMWQYRDQVQIARYWLYSGADNISFVKHKSYVSDIKKQIKNVKEKINFFLTNEADITGLKSLDVDKLEDNIEKSKTKRREYKNILGKIKKNKIEILNLEFMTRKENKTSKGRMFYISALDINTNEPIQVKADMERLFNFSNTPLNEISNDSNVRIAELRLANESLERKLDEKSKDIMEEGVGEMVKYDLSSLEDTLKSLEARLATAVAERNEFNESQKETKRQIRMMNQKVSKDVENISKKFSGFDSGSGSDKFVSKVSNFIGFAENIKAINFPLFIDSFKEKDFDVENQEYLLKYMDGFSVAFKKQVFMTATSPKDSLLKGIPNFLLKW